MRCGCGARPSRRASVPLQLDALHQDAEFRASVVPIRAEPNCDRFQRLLQSMDKIKTSARTRRRHDLLDDELADRMLPPLADLRLVGAEIKEMDPRDAASLGRQLEQLAYPRRCSPPLDSVQGAIARLNQADAEGIVSNFFCPWRSGETRNVPSI